MKKLGNTGTELKKKRCLYKKSVYNNQGINSWNAKVAEQIIWLVSI